MQSVKASMTTHRCQTSQRAGSVVFTPQLKKGSRMTAVQPVAFRMDANDAIKIADKLPKKLLIDGKWTDATSGKKLKVVDPRTEDVIMECAAADKSDVEKAVAAARHAFDKGPWPKMTNQERSRIMYKLSDIIESKAEELALLETLDVGKPFDHALMDIHYVVDHMRYFGGWANKIHGKTKAVDYKMYAYTLREPVGVVAQIVPWNFPTVMMSWALSPALICGNTVVLKASEQTPLTAMRLGELALEAGVPPGVINILTGSAADAGHPLVASKHVDKIAFFGSTDAGRAVGEIAGRHIKSCILELGGSNPVIVDKNVSVKFAVETVHAACFWNAGQSSTAGSRIYVHADIYDEFVDMSKKLAEKRRVGDPFDEVDQGPLAHKEQLDRTLHYIEQGKREGAKLITGGHRKGDHGFYMEPTIFADCADEMAIMKEEIFGPVMCITKYHEYEEAIKRANHSHYGLAAGVMSNNVHVINAMTLALKAGTIWVNCYNKADPAFPFGGFKDSGVGHVNSELALEEYTQVKSVYQIMEMPSGL